MTVSLRSHTKEGSRSVSAAKTKGRRTKAAKAVAKASTGIKAIQSVFKAQKDMTLDLLDQYEKRLIRTYETRNAPMAEPLSHKQLEEYSARPVNMAMANALASVPIEWLAENRAYIQQIDYAYSHLPPHCPRPTQQSHSGRCWLFAALNTIRYKLITEHHLNERFELSEAFLFFYDKIERSLFFLEKMIELRDTPLHDVVVNGMIKQFSPACDGGTWSFFLNLITKYGIVPKCVYGEGFNSSDTALMNSILFEKVAEFAMTIRSSKLSSHKLQDIVRKEYMPEIYGMMVKFMGEPPKKFDWNYHESSDNYEGVRQRGEFKSVKDLTPITFYNTFIESEMKLQNKVLLRHDPRDTSPYYRTYHVEHFGSMVGGKPEVAMNVPWEVLSRTAADAVMNGQQLWFSADMGKCMSYEHGVLSTEAYDYAGIMDTTFDMDKATSLDANVSAPTHAMALVGVDVKDDDPTQVRKWKVENSWGESSGGEDPGYFLMTAAWFEKYGYEIVVDLDYLDDKTREAYLKYEFDPIPLPYNDAFGAVARICKCGQKKL